MGYIGNVKLDNTTHLVGSTLYGTCSTNADTVAKSVVCTNFDTFITGVTIHVKFSNGNTAASPTLNVNSKGAKDIYINSTKANSTYSKSWRPGQIVSFTYDGTNWIMNDFNSNYPSAVCYTSAATAAKTADCSDYKLQANNYIHVIVVESNTSANALTLNIQGTGAKSIYINGTASSSSNKTLPAGSYLVFYDGTNYYFRTDGALTTKCEDDTTNRMYLAGVSYSNNVSSIKKNSSITAQGGALYATSATLSDSLLIDQGWSIDANNIWKEVTISDVPYKLSLHVPPSESVTTSEAAIAIYKQNSNSVWESQFNVNIDGYCKIYSGSVGGWISNETMLRKTTTTVNNTEYTVQIKAPATATASDRAIDVFKLVSDESSYPFSLRYDGTLDGIIINNLDTKDIKFAGTNITNTMIKFIDNTQDAYGNGIAIGGGGPTVIGGGESAATVIADTTKFPNINLGGEYMVVANDGAIQFLSNCGDTANIKEFTMTATGNFTAPGSITGNTTDNDIFVWARNENTQCYAALRSYGGSSGKGSHGLYSQAYYNSSTNAAVSSNQWMCYRVANDAKVHLDSAGSGTQAHGDILSTNNIKAIGAGEHYCEAQNSTTGARILLDSNSSGTIGLWSNGYYASNALVTDNAWLIYRGSNGFVYIRAGYGTNIHGTPIVSNSNDTKQIYLLTANSSTQMSIYGQWGSSGQSSLAYRYVNVTTSDPRLKDNIVDTKINALSIINKIKMRSFDWKTDNKHWDVGYIATEMYDIDHNLVMLPDPDEDKDGYWSVNDYYLSGIQTKAIQELSEENKQLKSEVSKLKEALSIINDKLKKIEVQDNV